MDSLAAAAARALAYGDPLGALARIALRDDAAGLALRGMAMAQLGEHARARDLLRRAARAFGASHESIARSRCVVAEAEVALAMRDLGGSTRALQAAEATLDTRGDRLNAQQARLVLARRLVLLGRLEEAEAALGRIEVQAVSPSLAAVAALTAAEIDLRRLRVESARRALAAAATAATRAGVPALCVEVAEARTAFERPVAREVVAGRERALRPGEVADLLDSGALVVDACRRGIRQRGLWRSLQRRPVLFDLARALAEPWPDDAERRALIARVFRTRRPDETHRARLRVEIGRLRALLGDVARIEATARGFVLRPQGGVRVVVLAPPIDGAGASVRALLADGAAWSTSALALALGTSARTVQRALQALEAAGHVQPLGHARARRWRAAPLTGFATTLLLPAALPPA